MKRSDLWAIIIAGTFGWLVAGVLGSVVLVSLYCFIRTMK